MHRRSPRRTKSWIFYAALLVLFWGVWGAFSALPATKYGYPDEMIYSIWALTMIIPAVSRCAGSASTGVPSPRSTGC